jgi:hypothetical protein
VGVRLIYRGRGNGLRIAFTAFGAATACVAGAVLLLMLLPKPHNRAHYLIAGMTPTVLGLFGMAVWIQRVRTRPRSWVVRRATPGS